MDNVCNRCLFSIPSKVEMAEEQEYLRYSVLQTWHQKCTSQKKENHSRRAVAMSTVMLQLLFENAQQESRVWMGLTDN